jgi:hypothetical protein
MPTDVDYTVRGLTYWLSTESKLLYPCRFTIALKRKQDNALARSNYCTRECSAP